MLLLLAGYASVSNSVSSNKPRRAAVGEMIKQSENNKEKTTKHIGELRDILNE